MLLGLKVLNVNADLKTTTHSLNHSPGKWCFLSCFLFHIPISWKTFPKDTNSGSFLSICLQLCFPQHTSVQGSMIGPHKSEVFLMWVFHIYIDLRTRSFYSLFAYKKVFRHKFSLSFLEIWQKTKNSSFSLKLFWTKEDYFPSSVCTWEGGKWGEERGHF